jgi:hypothetical protein
MMTGLSNAALPLECAIIRMSREGR